MENINKLRICDNCGTVYAAETLSKYVIQCPNCSSNKYEKISI